MYPGVHAQNRPDHAAMVMWPSGATVTYRALDRRSAALVNVLRRAGLGLDSTVAVVAENRLEWSDSIWATMRSGMTLAPIARGLTGEVLHRVLRTSNVHAVITTTQHADAVRAALDGLPDIALRLCVGGAAGFLDYEESLQSAGDEPIDEERLGSRLNYSSGTTGCPKAIRHPRLDVHPADAAPHLGPYTDLVHLDSATVYLSPAPTYHTAPMRFVISIQQLGGTVICQEKFDAEGALAAIEQHGVTHAQFVPTMLKRMLALPARSRTKYDLSSLRVAITGAAPCPPELKIALDEWWGPVLHELYGASESYGNCHIGPLDAREHPGSVGKALVGTIHILSPAEPDGPDLDTGSTGQVWFEGTAQFVYEGDGSTSAAARNARGWATVGDLGRLDDDRFLYLSGRADHVINSGGVKIDPQLAENCLLANPFVADACVVGLTDEDLGQRAHAVVVLESDASPSAQLADDLLAYVRATVSAPQCPRALTFVDALPRGENGKLYKSDLPMGLGGRRISSPILHI